MSIFYKKISKKGLIYLFVLITFEVLPTKFMEVNFVPILELYSLFSFCDCSILLNKKTKFVTYFAVKFKE